MAAPRAKNSGTIIKRLKYGSNPKKWQKKKAPYIASMTKSPWAKLINPMRPKIIERPKAMSAYTIPVKNPVVTSWIIISILYSRRKFPAGHGPAGIG
jgi:hypothetical protein